MSNEHFKKKSAAGTPAAATVISCICQWRGTDRQWRPRPLPPQRPPCSGAYDPAQNTNGVGCAVIGSFLSYSLDARCFHIRPNMNVWIVSKVGITM